VKKAFSVEKPTHVRYQVLAVACSLAVLTYIQRQGFIAATPYIKKDLGLHDGQLGSLFAIWLVAYGIFQVPGGLVGDRIGARSLLTLLVLGWSSTLLVVASTIFLPAGTWLALASLLVLRFIFGGFQAGVFPGLARVVADWMTAQQRGFAQGSIWTFSRLGGAVAPVFVVFLITEVFGGWASTITLIAGLGLMWSAFFWLWFRNRPEEMRQLNSAERELISRNRPAVRLATGPAPWRELLTSPSVWGLCLMYGFVGFAGNFITNFLNVYLHDHRHLPDDTTAWLAGLPLAAGVVSCLSGGVTSDWLIQRLGSRKWGRRLVGCVVLAFAGLATLCTPWVQEVWQLAIVLGAWMFFNDAMLGPAWASCADIGERHAGTLSGAMNMTGAFLGAAGMKLAGWWLDSGHYFLLFTVFACSYGLAALCWFAVDVTKPLVPPQGDATSDAQ
jgi:ACS family glucarate transporter-like MFS transporter